MHNKMPFAAVQNAGLMFVLGCVIIILEKVQTDIYFDVLNPFGKQLSWYMATPLLRSSGGFVVSQGVQKRQAVKKYAPGEKAPPVRR